VLVQHLWLLIIRYSIMDTRKNTLCLLLHHRNQMVLTDVLLVLYRLAHVQSSGRLIKGSIPCAVHFKLHEKTSIVCFISLTRTGIL
jgi:hypothetical protein